MLLMENVMVSLVKSASPLLVLMIVGTGFMYAHPTTTGLSVYRNFCIRFLFLCKF